ncbi:DUF6318 family protein [Georgenia satyanarayanai]|nr:DUF6318 family protein [Georgenia satyanarayanai]
MERDDIEGAEAAARYFMELYHYIFATGDLKEWQSMSGPDCRFCAGAAERVQELFADGGYATGGAFAVQEVETQAPSERERATLVALTGVEAPSREYGSDGAEIASLEGGPATYIFALDREGATWIVVGGDVEGAEE